MKSESELRARIFDLIGQEFRRRVDLSRTRLPHLCTYNHRQPLDNRRTVLDEPNPNFNRITTARHLPVLQTMGLCMYGSESVEHWPGVVCDEPIDAKRCNVFRPKTTKASVLSQFEEDLKNPQWLVEQLPEVSSLVWALGCEVEVKLSWWTKFVHKIRRHRVEEQAPALDYSEILKALDVNP